MIIESPVKQPQESNFTRYSKYQSRPTLTDAEITDDTDEREGDFAEEFELVAKYTRRMPCKPSNISRLNKTTINSSKYQAKSL